MTSGTRKFCRLYQSKHHIGAHHQAVCPWCLHHDNSPLVLPRASKPSSLKGCVGTLPEGYVRNIPLPRVPKIQRARSHQVTKIPDYYKDSYAVPKYDITRKLVGSSAYAFSPAWHAGCILATTHPRITVGHGAEHVVSLFFSDVFKNTHE